jgi:hypothetical protein
MRKKEREVEGERERGRELLKLHSCPSV